MPSGEHPFDGDMILIKNKNKNKNMCNYPTAAYIFFSNMCQWILIAVLSVWSVFSPPQSFWNAGMWSQPGQRALIINAGSYFCQFTAELLQNFCFEPQNVALCWYAVEFMGSVFPESFVDVCGVECIPTFKNLLHRGVLAFGRWTVQSM